MMSEILKYTQWFLAFVCGLSFFAFVLIVSDVENGKLTVEQLFESVGAWRVFAVSLLVSLGLKAYREYVAGKMNGLSAIVQIVISVAVIFLLLIYVVPAFINGIK